MIGIVIPVHDGERFLAQAVESVLRQTREDWRLVIVDDGSRDASGRVADAFARRDGRVCVVHQGQSGVSAARNRGFAALAPDAPYVSFLDADDVWVPDALQTLVDALQAHPGVPAVYGLGRAIDADGRPVEDEMLEASQLERFAVGTRGLEPWPADGPATFEVMAHYDCIATIGTVLFRRPSLVAAGLFDPSLGHFEDWDVLMRVARLGPLPFERRLVLGKRRHEHNVSNDADAMWRGLRQVRRKLLGLASDDPHRRRILLLGQRYSHRENRARELTFAARCLRSGDRLRGVNHVLRAATCGLKDALLGMRVAVDAAMWTMLTGRARHNEQESVSGS